MVASVPPSIVPLSADSSPLFSEEEINKIKAMTGIQQRVVATDSICASDLMTDAAVDLLNRLNWSQDSIDLLVVVTQSGDYPLPATSCVVQRNLGLSKGCMAFDIGLGCSGYTYGLSIVGAMMQGGQIRRALLLAGDTSSRMASPTDRSTTLLFGDVGTATALEFCDDKGSAEAHWSFVGGTDGNGFANLIIPDGGFRNPSSEAGTVSSNGQLGRYLFMDGGEIFKFTIEVVPPLIAETLLLANKTIADVDYFLMHQANLFLLKHLSKKMKIMPERMPITLDRYGNTSCASIPLTMIDGIGDKLDGRSLDLMLVGFGVGYSWGCLYLPIRKAVACGLKTFGKPVLG